MSTPPPCPNCEATFSYEGAGQWICPSCFHEWSTTADIAPIASETVYTDAFGNPLHDGDCVTVIKDLKIKGTSQSVKVGTKVKNIRLVDGDHNIDCKIDGIGPMKLKSEFVKKS